MRSLSRTGRPLTNRYWPSALARVSVGSAAKPSMVTPSRSAAISTALARKSAPSTSPSRASRPVAPGSVAAKLDRRAFLAGQREGDVRPAHGEPAHHLAHRFGFGTVELEEFKPRRRGVEQVAHFDAGALPQRRGLHLGFGAGIDLDRPAMRLAGVAGRDRKPRHRADRGQGLAAEPQRADRDQIVVGELRRGMALDGKRKIGRASCPRRRRPTRISRRPPPSVKTSMRLAPASSAFSINSLTTLAGRSTTSPAAMRLTMASESWRMGMGRRGAVDLDDDSAATVTRIE